MGQQQLILIILCTILVGAAIAVGILLFQTDNVSSNRDAMVEELNNIAGNAQAFYMRPKCMGGGGNSYAGYDIPKIMKSSQNGNYIATSSDTKVDFVGTSSQNDGIVKATLIKTSEQMAFTYFNAFDDTNE